VHASKQILVSGYRVKGLLRMTEGVATSGGAAWRRTGAAVAEERHPAPGVRRRLQLVLAGIWLLDAVLQYQSAMFTKAFARMLAGSAAGNPAVIADPVTWSARIIGNHVVGMNAVFATIQLLIGLGIAWRPTVRIALGASIVWALAVWWLGEGLGMILTTGASPLNGAPGAVIIYALLAVLLWPVGTDRPAPFVAGRAVGFHPARVLWLVLWGSLAYFALTPASRAPQAASNMLSGMASGQPGWLAWIDSHAASALSHHGLAVSVVLAIAFIVVAVGVCFPAPAARAALVLALVLAAALWLAEGLGGMLTGSGTDPNSGPLLALLAIAYWPVAKAVTGTGAAQVPASTGER
jgi:hypothetical protein